MMVENVTFANFWSRFFARRVVRNQFPVPRIPPRRFHFILKWYERLFLNVDLRNIRIERPIFLIGMHRSGTTILQDILCSLPEVGYFTNFMQMSPNRICAAEHLRKLLKLDAKSERYLQDGIEVSSGSPNEGVQFWEKWVGEEVHSLEHSKRTRSSMTPEQLEEIDTQLRRCLWTFPLGTNRFFSKNPRLVPYVKLLSELFPDAKFIHLLRDPRQCANSMLKLYRLTQEQLVKIKSDGRPHGIYDEKPFNPYPRLPILKECMQRFGPEDIRTTAHLWNEGVNMVRRDAESLSSYYEIRYEDILENPKKEILDLCDFCELHSPQAIDSQFWELLGTVGKVNHKNNYGEFQIVEEICGETMQGLGYRLDTEVAVSSKATIRKVA